MVIINNYYYINTKKSTLESCFALLEPYSEEMHREQNNMYAEFTM